MVHLLSNFWCPEEQVHKRSLRDAVPYEVWIDDGFITATPGSTIDYAFIPARIKELCARYRIKAIMYDPSDATSLVQELRGDGLNMVEMRQGLISMNAPTKEFEWRVLSQEIDHAAMLCCAGWRIT